MQMILLVLSKLVQMPLVKLKHRVLNRLVNIEPDVFNLIAIEVVAWFAFNLL